MFNGATWKPKSAEASTPLDQIVGEEWALLRKHHPNVLVFAPEGDAGLVVSALTPSLRAPVRHWIAPASRCRPAGAQGTLVIRDVSALDAAEQHDLFRWLSQRSGEDRPQVLAVTPVPLFPLVQRGVFLDTLYYLLNVVHLVVHR